MQDDIKIEEEVIHEDWTFKKSRHFRTSRRRWTVLSRSEDGKVFIKTFRETKRPPATETFEITKNSVVIVKEDPTKFRIFLNGLDEGYRSFATADDSLAQIWCSAIGKVINEMNVSKEITHTARNRRIKEQKIQIRNNKSLYEDSSDSSETELKFMPSKPLDRDSWTSNVPSANKNITVVETEYGFKAVSVPSAVKEQRGAPPTSAPVFSPPVGDEKVLRLD